MQKKKGYNYSTSQNIFPLHRLLRAVVHLYLFDWCRKVVATCHMHVRHLYIVKNTKQDEYCVTKKPVLAQHSEKGPPACKRIGGLRI